MAETAYRSDIDGLRAVAVSAVIAYHLSADALPGGYLGVDIFFVLSGFLITTIIWNELEADRFSIRKFYERRVRRIMPALIAMLIPTCLLAVVVLLPADLIGFARSLLATIVFCAQRLLLARHELLRQGGGREAAAAPLVARRRRAILSAVPAAVAHHRRHVAEAGIRFGWCADARLAGREHCAEQVRRGQHRVLSAAAARMGAGRRRAAGAGSRARAAARRARCADVS